MPNSDQKETKLAPIFDLKSTGQINKQINGQINDNINQNVRRKRKKKSKKNENKSKTIKKFDNNCVENDLSDTIVCRRSRRLESKVCETDLKINYNEDTDEEFVCEKIEEVIDLNDSLELLDQNSDTIDYWNDHKNNDCLQIDSTDEDIEILSSDNSLKICSQESVMSSGSQFEERKECLLWTEKYKPMNSCEIVGHKTAVNRLKSWLEDWGNTNDNKIDDYESEDDSRSGFDDTNSCLLICGPTGSGKTSAVYAIAEELKYEVLELNASMKRNGRIISKILGEATQSHQMQRNIDSNGLSQSIHSFFNTVSNNNINKVRNDIKSVKNNKKVKPKGILNYFSKQSKSEEIQIIDNQLEEITEIESKNDSVVNINEKPLNNSSLFVPKVLTIATNSLILFDDIDVLIDDDFNGFWSAFNKINETTKKPVILTATQFVPYIKECVNRLQVITFDKPNTFETIECLENIYLKELVGSDSDKSTNVCQYLSTTYSNDIRRCLNELQFGTDWQQIPSTDSLTKEMTTNKMDITSYYDSLLFTDVFQNNFRILSDLDFRENWMKCKPNIIENESQSITLAKDMIESINELNFSINRKRVNTFKSIQLSKPIDSQSIECISHYLSPNINLKTIILDYCPHLSFICQSEAIRQSQTANHSRKSRRFMHHLDSIGFFIDNVVKTKLISSFIPKESELILDQNCKQSNSGHRLDDYFYE